jgi:oligoribonuclease NrnB/cAMP/cGMP phosphodiesterase (DHH superfamily)
MFKKIIQFTHNDLDGYACTVVAKLFARLVEEQTGVKIPVESHNCDYGTIDFTMAEKMKSLEKSELEETLFIVSDISWKSMFVTSLLSNTEWFVFADHHKSSEYLAREMSKLDKTGKRMSVSIEGKWCGAYKLYDCLSTMLPENGIELQSNICDRLEDFLEIVNDWDLWLWTKDPKVVNQKSAFNLLNQKSPKLNAFLDFLSEYFKGSEFVDRMVDLIFNPVGRSFKNDLNRLYTDTEGFQEYICRQADTIEESTSKYYRFHLGMTVYRGIDALLFTVPEGFSNKSIVSMVANDKTGYLKKDFDCLMIYEIGSDTVSLRYPNDGIDLSEVAKYNTLAKNTSGGGHPFAAGFPVEPDKMMEEIESIRIRNL